MSPCSKPLHALEIPQTTLQLFTKNIDKNSKMTTLITQKLTIKRTRAGMMHVDGEPVETEKEIRRKNRPRGAQGICPHSHRGEKEKRK